MATERRGHFPTKEDILKFIRGYEGKVTKREIARSFGIKGPEKIQLKQILRELKEEGHLSVGKAKALRPAGRLPNVQVIEFSGVDKHGDALARPESWDQEGTPPTIYISDKKKHHGPPMGRGDRALARLIPIQDDPPLYRAEIIKLLKPETNIVFGMVLIILLV
ncbi:MAG: hypothetical protein COB37_09625 [Kordiimonadales bacterium]|nr:MAG: hypothetical protein COB37_09625 [Kordiimonadales bacterium]